MENDYPALRNALTDVLSEFIRDPRIGFTIGPIYAIDLDDGTSTGPSNALCVDIITNAYDEVQGAFRGISTPAQAGFTKCYLRGFATAFVRSVYGKDWPGVINIIQDGEEAGSQCEIRCIDGAQALREGFITQDAQLCNFLKELEFDHFHVIESEIAGPRLGYLEVL